MVDPTLCRYLAASCQYYLSINVDIIIIELPTMVFGFSRQYQFHVDITCKEYCRHYRSIFSLTIHVSIGVGIPVDTIFRCPVRQDEISSVDILCSYSCKNFCRHSLFSHVSAFGVNCRHYPFIFATPLHVNSCTRQALRQYFCLRYPLSAVGLLCSCPIVPCFDF